MRQVVCERCGTSGAVADGLTPAGWVEVSVRDPLGSGSAARADYCGRLCAAGGLLHDTVQAGIVRQLVSGVEP